MPQRANLTACPGSVAAPSIGCRSISHSTYFRELRLSHSPGFAIASADRTDFRTKRRQTHRNERPLTKVMAAFRIGDESEEPPARPRFGCKGTQLCRSRRVRTHECKGKMSMGIGKRKIPTKIERLKTQIERAARLAGASTPIVAELYRQHAETCETRLQSLRTSRRVKPQIEQ